MPQASDVQGGHLVVPPGSHKGLTRGTAEWVVVGVVGVVPHAADAAAQLVHGGTVPLPSQLLGSRQPRSSAPNHCLRTGGRSTSQFTRTWWGQSRVQGPWISGQAGARGRAGAAVGGGRTTDSEFGRPDASCPFCASCEAAMIESRRLPGCSVRAEGLLAEQVRDRPTSIEMRRAMK